MIENVSIEEFAVIVRGSSPRPSGDPRYYGGTIPRLMVSDVTRDGMYVTPKIDFLTLEGATKSRAMLKGDLIIAVSGDPGEPCILNVDACIHDGFVGLRNLNKKRVFTPYLYQFLKFNKKNNRDQAVGAIYKNLNTDQIKNLQIPLPPLSTQQKIASILDAADALRQKDKALLAKYDELLKAYIMKCFGQALNRDVESLKSGDTEYLADGFTWYELTDITEVISDIDHKMPKSVNHGKLFLSAKDLSDNGELDFSKPKYISEEDFRHLSRKIKPRKGDVIYSRIGAKLGKARLVKTDHDFIVSYSCCTIRPNHEKVSSIYLRYILDSEFTLKQANHGTKGIGVPDLGMGEIRSFKIPVPKLILGNKIEKELVLIEQQKALAQASLEKSEELFNSLLQKAFKGELV